MVYPGILYACENHANILNFSWGNRHWFDDDINNIINYAYEKYGVIMIAAVGNERDSTTISWPASHPYVIPVSGTTTLETGYPQLWWWNSLNLGDPPHGSNYSTTEQLTKIAAPVSAVCLLPENSYGTPETDAGIGTSCSSANVAGVTALMLSVNPCLREPDVLDILERTADKIPGYNYNWNPAYPGFSRQLGCGRINAYRAVLMASDTLTVIKANENKTYNTPKWFAHNLTIKNGGALTITSTVKFTEGKKIIVERGGRLILNGGTLTSTCPTWGGVEVQGNSDAQQEPTSNQGYVYVCNNGKIERAHIGINSINGGIVLVDSASFVNDFHSICISNYHHRNISRISRSHFVWSNNPQEAFLNPIFIDNPFFIGLQNLSSIQISGCTFENNLYNDPTFDQAGYGIVCSNSDLILKDWQVNNQYVIPVDPRVIGQRNQFKRLKYGLYGLTTGENTIYISGSIFENNLRGAYLSGYRGSAFARVYTTKFKPLSTGQSEGPHVGDSYGLYLNTCTGYSIEENEFYNSISDTLNHEGIGLIINQSGGEQNELYNNKFHGLNYASLAQNCNRLEDFQGLCFECNDFYQNDNDITISSSNPSSQNQGIAVNQGNKTWPAYNTFTVGNDDYFDIYNPMDQINYYEPIDNGGYNLHPFPAIGVSTISNQDQGYNKLNDCPSRFSNSKTAQEMHGVLEDAQIKRDSTRLVLQSLIDGGATENLVYNVQNSSPDNALQLRNDLIDKSPYLSDSVMKTAVFKENVLTNSMLRDILIENPQSSKSVAIMDAVDQRNNPMPDSLVAQIQNGLDFLGAKEEKESVLAHWNQRYADAMKSLIHLFSEDTTGVYGSDSLISLLNKDNSLETKFDLINYYYYLGNFTAGNSTLSNILVNFNLSDKQQQTYYRFSELFPILQQVKTNSSGFEGLDSNQVVVLHNLAQNDDDLPGAYARNLLVMNGQLQYQEPIIFPSSLKETRKMHDVDPSHSDYKEYWLKIYPNPAKNSFTVEYRTIKSKSANSDITISVTDLNGQEIMVYQENRNFDQMTISTENLANGEYLVLLKENGNSVNHAKLTVNK